MTDRRIAAWLFVLSAIARVPFRSDSIFHRDSYGLAAGVLYTLTAHPPGFIGYCVLVRFAYWLVGDVSLAFVVVNVLATGAATALAFLLGRHMFGRREGIIAAVIYATSMNVSYFAEVALTYAAEGAFATAAGLTGWLSVKRRSFGWLLAHSAVLAVGGSVRQTTLVFLFPLWVFVVWRSVSRWPQRAAATVVLVLIVGSWSVPNAEHLAKYWNRASYVESFYRLQVAMEQDYDSTSFGKVRYEPKRPRFHWPLVELGAAAWNRVHSPGPNAPIELRTASASHAFGMIRYQSAKLAFYLALSMGVATIFVFIAFVPRVRETFGFERTLFLALWILPPALFFALNHFGAWGYLLIFLAALAVMAARSIVLFFPTTRAQTIVVATMGLASIGAFLVMRPLPEASDRNRTINVALLQYGAPAIRMRYARSRSRAYTSDPRQLPVDCVTDECLKRDLSEFYDLPPDLRSVEPLWR